MRVENMLRRKTNLIRFDPDDFVNTGVAPYAQTFSPYLHGSASYPEKQQALILERRDRHRAHLVVCHRPVRQLGIRVNHCFDSSQHLSLNVIVRTLMWISHGGSAMIT